jgi:hypothetical protein
VKYGTVRRANCRPHTVERARSQPIRPHPTAEAIVTPMIHTMLVNHSVDQSTATAASHVRS